MQITHFALPQTKLCTVVWYRNDTPHETLIQTPGTNRELVEIMFNHKVGKSEIRAVKPVEPKSILKNAV